jgi:hypothetical protein
MGARDLLNHLEREGFTVAVNGNGGFTVAPAARLTDQHRNAIRACRDALAALLVPSPPIPWSGEEIDSFTVRHARLRAAGLSDDQADRLAERLVYRDRQGDDLRVCAAECGRFHRGRCRGDRRAGVGAELGTLAFIPQRCQAFSEVQP